MKDLSSDLFVNCDHLCQLHGKSISTARRELRNIRLQFGVVSPKRVTRDQICLFYEITLQQYIDRMKRS